MPSQPSSSSSLLFTAFMVLAMISWGGSWVTAKWASAYPPELTAFWRFLLSALSFLPILWWRRESLALPRKTWIWVSLSAISLAGYNLLFLFGVQHGPGGFGGVLVPTMNPLFAFLLALIFLKQGVGRWAGLGLFLGLCGGILQILGPNFHPQAFLEPANVFLVGAALVYAILTQFSAVAQRDISVFRYSFWTSLLCALILLPFASFRTPSPWSFTLLGSDFWINTLYLALAAGTFGTTLYFEAARRIGAARGSSFAFLVPVSALVLAFVFLGEVPAWTSVVGGALSIAAVTLVQIRTSRRS